MACVVRTGRDIRAGELPQPRCGLCALLSLPEITAIDQEVGLLAEGLPDRSEFIRIGAVHGFQRQSRRTKRQSRLGSVGDDMHCVDAGPTSEGLRHLLHAVAGWIEDNHFNVGADAVEQLLVVADTGGQEQDLLAGDRGIVHRQGIEQRLVAGGGLRFARRGSGRVIGCRRVSLTLRELLGGDGAGRLHGSPVEHDARFECQQ